MSQLRIAQNTTAVDRNVTTPFSASGGETPYAYSVLPDGAGGTIDEDTGLYTAPDRYGIDTVRVTDDDGKHFDAKILVGPPIELVCDILRRELSLAWGQVYLWDTKWTVPKDSRLYVAIGEVSCKPFGNNRGYSRGLDDLRSAQGTNFSTMLSLDIMSKGPEARLRKEELLMALNSEYAQRQQELNTFRVFPLTTGFVNISLEDGAAIPYRYNITVMMQYAVSRRKEVDYYDTLQGPTITPDYGYGTNYLTTQDGETLVTEDGDKILATS